MDNNEIFYEENFQELNNYDAWAEWEDSINIDGWYKFYAESKKDSKSSNIMRCIGYLEGRLSQYRIFQHYQLIKDIHNFSRNEEYSEEWKYFMDKNRNFTEESVFSYSDEIYWKQVGLILNQFNGLFEGYNSIASNLEKLSIRDFWFLQAECELWDVERALKPIRRSIQSEAGDHCSGLIRILPDYSDIYVSHDTWSDYRDLHGQLKEYHINIPEFKATRVIFSTRVGKLFSYDDFYIADTGLIVLETTMNIFNQSLYDLVHPETLFTWIRAVRSMWCSINGSEWTESFIKHNSGTLNNQYLILDTKKFKRFEKPSKDLLWLIEQYPGNNYERYDITNLLIQKGYFPSINVPFTLNLYNIAGYPDKVKSMNDLGYLYSYYDSPRYLIFSRESPRIYNFEDFKNLMTYNNYLRDPFSHLDPAQSIYSRYDLRNFSNPYQIKKPFGGLDSKCIKYTEFLTRLSFQAIAGPINNKNIPIWEFDQEPFKNIKYDGLPKKWNFSWIEFKGKNYDICKNLLNLNDCINQNLCGWCLYEQKCYPGDFYGPFFNIKCESGWKYKEYLQPWALPIIIIVSTTILLIVISIFTLNFLYNK